MGGCNLLDRFEISAPVINTKYLLTHTQLHMPGVFGKKMSHTSHFSDYKRKIMKHAALRVTMYGRVKI